MKALRAHSLWTKLSERRPEPSRYAHQDGTSAMRNETITCVEVRTVGDLKQLVATLPDDMPISGDIVGDEITAVVSTRTEVSGSRMILTFEVTNTAALGTRHPMGIVSTIGQCKKQMTPAGWRSFCAQRISDPFSPFDPEICADSQSVFLTRQETCDYEYAQSAE